MSRGVFSVYSVMGPDEDEGVDSRVSFRVIMGADSRVKQCVGGDRRRSILMVGVLLAVEEGEGRMGSDDMLEGGSVTLVFTSAMLPPSSTFSPWALFPKDTIVFLI